jgi:hypothetical protein
MVNQNLKLGISTAESCILGPHFAASRPYKVFWWDPQSAEICVSVLNDDFPPSILAPILRRLDDEL